MKLKGVSFIEMHIEKIVLGLGVSVLLVIIAMSFIMEPYAVKVGGKSVSPGEIGAVINDQVDELRDQLANGDQIPAIEIPSYSERYAHRLTEEVTAFAGLSSIGQGGMAAGEGPTSPDQLYYLPSPPAATNVQAVAGYAVLGEVSEANQQRLIDLVGASYPRDFRYVSVCGDYDLEAWIRRLDSSPPESGMESIPDHWWKQMLGVTAVYLQREERDPVSGEWGDRRYIEPLPTQIAYPPMLSREWDIISANEAIARIRDEQDRISRPDFVPLGQGIEWQRCDRVVEMDLDTQLAIQKLREEIEQLNEKIAKQEQLLIRYKGDQNRTESVERRLTVLRENLDEKIAERNAIFGIVDEGDDGGGPQAEQGEPQESKAASRQVDHQFKVWAHDLTVKPGGTYRYRLVVSLINPLFHKRNLHPKQREANYNRLALGPDPQELAGLPWSEPVTTDPEYYFFFVESPQNPKVEVWRVYNGFWRNHIFSVQQGDRIGGEAVIISGGESLNIDMNVGAVLVDVSNTTSLRGEQISYLYYLDLASNRIYEQVMNPQHPMRIRLQNESSKMNAIASNGP